MEKIGLNKLNLNVYENTVIVYIINERISKVLLLKFSLLDTYSILISKAVEQRRVLNNFIFHCLGRISRFIDIKFQF